MISKGRLLIKEYLKKKLKSKLSDEVNVGDVIYNVYHF